MDAHQETIVEQEVKVMRSLAESLLQTCNRIEHTLNPPVQKKSKGLSDIQKAEMIAKFRKSLNKKAASAR